MEGQVPSIEELLKNLKHQVTLYKRLVDLCREERKFLVAVQLKELRDCTYAKEALLDEIQREEYRRNRWVADAAKLIGLSEKEITLEIIGDKLAPKEMWEPILSLKNTLLVLIKKCAEMNQDNRKLAENALRDAQQMKRNVLGLTSDQPQVYGPKGNMGAIPDKSARLLNKEA